MLIDTYYKKTPMGDFKAELYTDTQGYYIEFYSPTGSKIKRENFYGKSKFYVEDAAVNWVNGIKVLNG